MELTQEININLEVMELTGTRNFKVVSIVFKILIVDYFWSLLKKHDLLQVFK